jgi:hypothetical protein
VILVDVNLLLNAYDEESPQHDPARRWLEGVLSGPDTVGFAWATIVAFLRIGTHPSVFARPLAREEATSIVSEWLARPNVTVLEAGERHWEILSRLVTESQARGPLVPDAHLAALAIEHGAVIHTSDQDFSRFAPARWVDPLA